MDTFGKIYEVDPTGNASVFGQLPKEVLGNIVYLFLLPTIDILAEYPPFYFVIKRPYTETRIKTSNWQFVNQKCKDNLNQFIDDLSNNMECHYNEYDESNLFEIHVDCSGIVIYNKLTDIYLPIESKDQLLSALHKYWDYLNKQNDFI